MPGKYDVENRTVIVETDFQSDPELASASLINGVLCDLLCQTNPGFAKFPELLDLAAIATGLGMLRSNLSFVSKSGIFWDSTQWDAVPRPFLDAHSVAYANAVAAWIRGDQTPIWFDELPSDVKKPAKKTLKYLFKTSDCFLNSSPARNSTLDHSQNDWWRLAASDQISTQTIAVRHLDASQQLSEQQASQLASKLHSNHTSVVLSAIVATERMTNVPDQIASALKDLVSSSHLEIQSKAMMALTRLELLDDRAIESAADMLDSSTKHNVFAGMFALGSQPSVDEHHMPAVDRAFMRSLKSCDYEFVGYFASAYNRWMDDPQSHLQETLQEHDAELLHIALEALEGTPKQVVSLG